jgi:hypothetical protein
MYGPKSGLAGIAAALTTSRAARAADTNKLGQLPPSSGQFAATAAQMDHGIKLSMNEHGDTVAGK